jgi:hypothetical protein
VKTQGLGETKNVKRGWQNGASMHMVHEMKEAEEISAMFVLSFLFDLKKTLINSPFALPVYICKHPLCQIPADRDRWEDESS